MSRPRRESSSRNRPRLAAAAALALTFATLPAAADELPPTSPDVELRHDLWIDVPATVVLAGGVAVYTNFLEDDLLPSHCRWCEGSGPSGVNAVDRWVRDTLVRDDT